MTFQTHSDMKHSPTTTMSSRSTASLDSPRKSPADPHTEHDGGVVERRARVQHYAQMLRAASTATFLFRTTPAERKKVRDAYTRELYATRKALRLHHDMTATTAEDEKGGKACKSCTCGRCARTRTAQCTGDLMRQEVSLLERTVRALRATVRPALTSGAGARVGMGVHHEKFADEPTLFVERRQVREYDAVYERVRSPLYGMLVGRAAKRRMLAQFKRAALLSDVRARDVQRVVHAQLDAVDVAMCKEEGVRVREGACAGCRKVVAEMEVRREFERLVTRQMVVVGKVIVRLEFLLYGRQRQCRDWVSDRFSAIRKFVLKE